MNNLDKSSLISSSQFFNNSCRKNGGALLILRSHLSLSSLTFNRNNATLDGGAIYFEGSASSIYQF